MLQKLELFVEDALLKWYYFFPAFFLASFSSATIIRLCAEIHNWTFFQKEVLFFIAVVYFISAFYIAVLKLKGFAQIFIFIELIYLIIDHCLEGFREVWIYNYILIYIAIGLYIIIRLIKYIRSSYSKAKQ